jgi:hypothetical protein
MELHYQPDESDERVFEVATALHRLTLSEGIGAIFAAYSPHQLNRISQDIDSYLEWRYDVNEWKLDQLKPKAAH